MSIPVVRQFAGSYERLFAAGPIAEQTFFPPVLLIDFVMHFVDMFSQRLSTLGRFVACWAGKLLKVRKCGAARIVGSGLCRWQHFRWRFSRIRLKNLG
jgi:hypothetical protein